MKTVFFEKISKISEDSRNEQELIIALSKFYPIDSPYIATQIRSLCKTSEQFRLNSVYRSHWFQKALLKYELQNLKSLKDFHDDGSHRLINITKHENYLKSIIIRISKVCGWNQKFRTIEKLDDCTLKLEFSSLDILLEFQSDRMKISWRTHIKRSSMKAIDDARVAAYNAALDSILKDLYEWLSYINLYATTKNDSSIFLVYPNPGEHSKQRLGAVIVDSIKSHNKEISNLKKSKEALLSRLAGLESKIESIENDVKILYKAHDLLFIDQTNT